ncbi:HEXXH motif domain-containing protein [Actinophytocola sp.]|uniref:HEXXH motif domain-containing protein n=1 Tax=Actinophytocola sp. TaxID=1872138 RepID=UPI002ECFDB7E
MLGTHEVSLGYLDALARGRSDPAIVSMLRQANRSKQLILLRAVLDHARDTVMSPLPAVEDAWGLFASAQRQDRAAVEPVITHPLNALWAARILRRLRGREADASGPLWADLGYVHQLATAAAIRAGQDFRFRVPVWRGAVVLPTLGRADVRSRREWDFAEVHAEHGNVLIRGPAGSVRVPEDPATDGDGWWALRVLRTHGWDLWLDDLDPFREFDGPIPPRREPPQEVELWADGVRRTWRLLADQHPATAAEVAAGVSTLVPRISTDRFTPSSASHTDAFGAVVMSRPADPTTFAATLVHELQHSKFGILLTLIDLLDPAGDHDTPRLYAPWRDDSRPADGLLHGLVSFLGVTAFYRERCAVAHGAAARVARFEFSYRREQVTRVTETLLSEATPSALGRRFLAAARAQLVEWAADPLPEDVRRAARRANADHYLSWRLRHLHPPDAVVDELAQAWSRHHRKPVVRVKPELRPSAGSAIHARLALTRTWLADPDLFEVYRAEPELAMAEIPGTTAADLALLDGDTDTAAELYQQQILAMPDPTTSWVGLALATEDAVLLDRPELVSALHREIRARSGLVTSPARLARWLA